MNLSFQHTLVVGDITWAYPPSLVFFPNKGTFERLEGNAVMISGYNRDATVESSDFAFLGGNAIVAWGYTNETSTDPGRPGIILNNAPKAGIDGTDGEHPVRTTVQWLGFAQVMMGSAVGTLDIFGRYGRV